MSFCELCGRQVTGIKRPVIIEGTVFNVCMSCSKHGKPYVPQPTSKTALKRKAPSLQKGREKIRMLDDTMLSSDFARIIREARTSKGLTHEQLGMRMSEKSSLLKKVETGSLKPDEVLARKLERALGIKLYVGINEQEEQK